MNISIFIAMLFISNSSFAASDELAKKPAERTALEKAHLENRRLREALQREQQSKIASNNREASFIATVLELQETIRLQRNYITHLNKELDELVFVLQRLR